MRFIQAAAVCGIFGWASFAVQAGWVGATLGPGLVPMAVGVLGAYPTVVLVFFVGALTAAILLLRNENGPEKTL